MSSAALSLDISHVVSRDLAGEPVDTQSEGAVLAEKYRELGMSADLIGKAIARASGMARQALSPPPALVAEAPEPAQSRSGDLDDVVARLASMDLEEDIAARLERELLAADPDPETVETRLEAAFSADLEAELRDIAPIAEQEFPVAKPDQKITPDMSAGVAPASLDRRRVGWPGSAMRRAFFRR